MNSQGQREIQMIPAARAFFQRQFQDGMETGTVEDGAVQRTLLAWMRSPGDGQSSPPSDQLLAEYCLRCFLSNQGNLVCQQLAQQFGQQAGFTWADLFSFLLDGDLYQFAQNPERIPGKPQTTPYQSVATKILQSFDPAQSQLSTWARRLMTSELNAFLLDHGVYLASEWSILCGIEPARLQRLCQRVHRLSELQTRQAVQLLEAFHAVYRIDRLQQYAKSSRSKYREPTEDQLQRMAAVLRSQQMDGYTPDRILRELRELSQVIRKARRPEQVSLQDPNHEHLLNQASLQPEEDDTDWKRVHQRYQQIMLDGLERSLSQVIDARVTFLQPQSKDQAYLMALQRFHCRSMTMGAIAKELGWQRQDQVTRLLKLKDLRDDVRQVWLVQLRDRVQELVATHTDATRLAELDQQLEAILSEDIAPILEEAAAEASTPKQPRKSRFSQRLCQYLDTRPDMQHIMGVEIAPLHP